MKLVIVSVFTIGIVVFISSCATRNNAQTADDGDFGPTMAAGGLPVTSALPTNNALPMTFNVEPNPVGSESMASKDAVQVLTRFAERSEGENSARDLSSNNSNYGYPILQGKPVKLVNDRIGHHESRAALPAGINLVHQVKDNLSSSEIRIGDSHFVLGGPLVDGLLPRRSGTAQSLGRRLLDLPIIRLLVPERLPSLTGDSVNYFAWGEPPCRPWTAIATGAPGGDDFDSLLNDEPQSGFVSLSW